MGVDLSDKDVRLAQRMATEMVTRAYSRAYHPHLAQSNAWAERCIRRIQRCLENQ